MRDDTAVLKSIDGEPLTLVGVSAHGKVAGLLFELTVEQRYRNATATNIEAVYTFPLPHHAVLLDLQVTLGERTLASVAVEKREAEEQYEQAIDKGDTAIMLERAGDGLLTLNLGNLMPDETAVIRYRYAQLLRFDHGSLRLTIPTVIAPRYGNPAADGLEAHQAPTIDPVAAYPFTLSLELEGAVAQGALTSPTHPISVTETAHGRCVTLNGPAVLDRDFVLSVADLAGHSLAAAGRDGNAYVALASFCLDVPPEQDELQLRLKLLLDCSGSMAGDSIDAARRALHRVLESMLAADAFSFSRFGSTVHHDMPRLTAATDVAIRTAADCVAHTHADLGGTEMEDALRSVFALDGDDASADVLLITDGEIWGADTLIAEARKARQRVFVVGIGSAPAAGVLRRLADATGGACEFVAPNEDAEAAILRMFARLRAPRVESAAVVWPTTPLWSTSLPQGLFGSETVHVYAGFETMPEGRAELHLSARASSVPVVTHVALPTVTSDESTIARMSAAARMQTADSKTQLALALEHSLLTDQTNFIVVHERAEREKAQHLPTLSRISQMRAAGWGGNGTVVQSVRRFAPMQAERRSAKSLSLFHIAPLQAPVDRLGLDSLSLDGTAASPADDFLKALASAVDGTGPFQMPETLDALETLGMTPTIIADLTLLVTSGHQERDVVLAFLQALEPRARELGLARQFLRVLRNAFSGTGEEAEWIAIAAGRIWMEFASQPFRF